MADLKLIVNGAEVIVPEADAKAAIEKGELTVKKDDLKVIPVTDYDTLISNTKNEEYNKGKIAGVEMAVKEQRETLGLQFEGKNVSNLLEAFKTKVLAEAKVEPNKRIEELEGDKLKLQSDVQSWQNKYTGLEQTYTKKERESKIDSMILQAIPSEGIAIPKDKLVKLFRMDYDVDIDESGKLVVKKDGELLKDELLNPKGLDKIIPDFVHPYSIKPGGQSGGSDKGGSGTGTMDAFINEMEKAGVKPTSMKFNEEMQARIKAGTLKV